MKQTIKPDELTKIKHAETASGRKVEYIRFEKMRNMHMLKINGELCYYSNDTFKASKFFVEK